MRGELERFARDLNANPALLEELKAVGTDPGAVIGFAERKGYRLALDDLHEAISRSGEELSESQLDQVAGGQAQVEQTTFQHLDKMSNETLNAVSRVLRTLGEMRQEGAAKRGGL